MNSARNVYKCLDNDNNTPSTVEPTGTNASTILSTADGYKWNWVGKNDPSGTPAITIDTGNNEYILYRLEK